MAQTCGISPEELHVKQGEYPEPESPLETAWTFWYDKKTTDRKESDQYMEGLKQLGSFNTIEGFYRHYSYLLRPSELPRDHNVLMFRKGYKPMWEEFPEGGCWIIRIKRKASQNYVNHMWENLLIACIGEAFEMPDVVGCVLSTRLKDDVLSIWNLNNRDTPARFRIGEKLKEVLDLNMTALIQYKDHMQSLQDYSTYRNARNYMFAPSPAATPLQGTLETPLHMPGEGPLPEEDFEGMLPPAAIDAGDMLPPAAVDSGDGEVMPKAPTGSAWSPATRTLRSPQLSANAAPWTPETAKLQAPPGSRSPPLSSAAAPFIPGAASRESPSPESKPMTWAAKAAAKK
jgi:translation initiation factor 4E|mmetsp:Transcript_10232/g.30395  ORF Transcript_10232/g.30395 Transcript_10232/m.30395 type:complete len:344 (-) Transcript_10232:97-1128(-)